jgi:3-deoxy-D-manno-octulosonate 8-phosphate phosphatase (KDO 8-P phosphatase)
MEILRRNLAFIGMGHIEPESLQVNALEGIAAEAGVTLADLLLFDLSTAALPWKDLKFIFLDVDGVLTEGGMHYTESGDEFKRFDTKDGMAIKVGMQHGLQFGIISSGVNKAIIQHRADMFGIEHVYVGTEPKLTIAKQWLDQMGIDWAATGYIGDDINDLKMFEQVAIAGCPSDATLPIKQAADFVLTEKGGHGCVRQFLRHHPQLKEAL